MKKLKRSCKLIADNNYDEKNGNKSLLLSTFDNEPGYYQEIIHPLLASKHETELIYWLKLTNLIKSKQTCSKRTIGGMCNNAMSWISAKGSGSYQWKCQICPKRKSIKDDSIFSGLSCSFKDAIRIILAWCKSYHVDSVSNMLGVNNSTVEELYIRSASVAERYMTSNIKEWQIGGPGIIVLVDTYPEGCANTSLTRMSRPILCLSEVKTMPQKYWLEALDRYSNLDTLSYLKQHILRIVQTIVRPGSILITPHTSTLCCYSDFEQLQVLYPIIVTTEELAKHNTDQQNVFTNLETIWKEVLNICEEAQFYCTSYIDLFLRSRMWALVYGNESFERLLYQISSMQ
ncbi:hypothetical protein NQ315_011173 [Exocentrus adspersus]|uniref:Uncharacterized protein n=1 Tax=Exocentrus adspersus TaxID=1586481 RepID=A0AAV8VZ45_9CUCU|nr:hypothetical protein NQ315_011173 [Exocentrus adspersus]